MTILFTVSTNGCTACCASAVNDALRRIERDSINCNVVVVVATPLPKEGLVFRKWIMSTNIVEDLRGGFLRAIDVDPLDANAILYDRSYREVARARDLQRNPGAIDTLLLDVRGREDTGFESVGLKEPDDHIVSVASSPRLSPDGRTLEFVDPRLNQIVRFDAHTGTFLGYFEPPRSLGFYFRRNTDNSTYWTSIEEHYAAMVRMTTMVLGERSDSAHVICEMFTGYDLLTHQDGKDSVVQWHKAPVLLTIANDSVVDVKRITTTGYILRGEPWRAGSTIVSQAAWERIAEMKESDARDSLYLITRFADDADKCAMFLPQRGIEEALGHKLSSRISASICTDSDSDLYLISGSSGLFLRGRFMGDTLAVQRLIPGGLLAAMPAFAAQTTPVSDSSIRRSYDSLYAVDIYHSDNRTFVLLMSKHWADRQHPLVIQAYDTRQHLISEQSIKLDGDEILSANIVDYRDSQLVLLLKREQARWSILRLSD